MLLNLGSQPHFFGKNHLLLFLGLFDFFRLLKAILAII